MRQRHLKKEFQGKQANISWLPKRRSSSSSTSTTTNSSASSSSASVCGGLVRLLRHGEECDYLGEPHGRRQRWAVGEGVLGGLDAADAVEAEELVVAQNRADDERHDL